MILQNFQKLCMGDLTLKWSILHLRYSAPNYKFNYKNMKTISSVSDETMDGVRDNFRDGGTKILEAVQDAHNGFFDSAIRVHKDIFGGGEKASKK